MQEIPKSLKVWFIIHFFVDMVFAIPLMFFPQGFLSLMGMETVEVVTVRLVAAALIAIGGTSFFAGKMSKDSFDTMLTLKLLWSSATILGLSLTLLSTFSYFVFLVLIIFILFFILWGYYKWGYIN